MAKSGLLQEMSPKDGASEERRGPEEQTEVLACKGLSKGQLLPGPPKPPSVAELLQVSTALSTLGTAGEKRVASRPPLRASGGSSSASLASLRLPDLRGRRGPRRRKGCHF
jgi:hypothetical protein